MKPTFKVLGICENLESVELFDSDSFMDCRDWIWRYVKNGDDGNYPMIVIAIYLDNELQSWVREYERDRNV